MVQIEKLYRFLLSFVHSDMVNDAGEGYWSPRDSMPALKYGAMIINQAQKHSIPFIGYPLKGIDVRWAPSKW